MIKPIPLAVTMGDPGGIGPEIILKTFQRHSQNRRFRYVVFGVPSVFEFLKKRQGLSFPFYFVKNFESISFRENRIFFVDVSEEAVRILRKIEKQKNEKRKLQFEKGKISAANGAMAYAALKQASKYAVQGKVSAIVTAPINKMSMRKINPGFSGHTEYLAKQAHAKRFAMMFVSPRLKVTLATIHVPLKNVSRLITPSLVFQKIFLTDQFLKKYFGIARPKIAVCAVNPHGAETGSEDEEKVKPAVRLARGKNIHAVGPLSADQLFFDAYEGRFDAVISMYHDQGLGPFKMIAFREGVNVTLGLPFIRTSPDHGTAFDIAYQGKADPVSMKSALALAEQLLQTRSK